MKRAWLCAEDPRTPPVNPPPVVGDLDEDPADSLSNAARLGDNSRAEQQVVQRLTPLPLGNEQLQFDVLANTNRVLQTFSRYDEL